mmetsp:Transcript_36279/g.116508  ORF Transcript_36279/g.116508 Transcript_36279/m.116508 type:complete len:222 (-) Transcript_36279:995-1660(-)
MAERAAAAAAAAARPSRCPSASETASSGVAARVAAAMACRVGGASTVTFQPRSSTNTIPLVSSSSPVCGAWWPWCIASATSVTGACTVQLARIHEPRRSSTSLPASDSQNPANTSGIRVKNMKISRGCSRRQCWMTPWGWSSPSSESDSPPKLTRPPPSLMPRRRVPWPASSSARRVAEVLTSRPADPRAGMRESRLALGETVCAPDREEVALPRCRKWKV